jgi:hypothetical protein
MEHTKVLRYLHIKAVARTRSLETWYICNKNMKKRSHSCLTFVQIIKDLFQFHSYRNLMVSPEEYIYSNENKPG